MSCRQNLGGKIDITYEKPYENWQNSDIMSTKYNILLLNLNHIN